MALESTGQFDFEPARHLLCLPHLSFQPWRSFEERWEIKQIRLWRPVKRRTSQNTEKPWRKLSRLYWRKMRLKLKACWKLLWTRQKAKVSCFDIQSADFLFFFFSNYSLEFWFLKNVFLIPKFSQFWKFFISFILLTLEAFWVISENVWAFRVYLIEYRKR